MAALAFAGFFWAACSTRTPEQVSAMTPEQVAAEKASAQAMVDTGHAVAASGEALPFPLNLLAAAGGAALILVGGRKAAALGKTAAVKALAPAVAVVANALCSSKDKENKGNSPSEAETSPEGTLASDENPQTPDGDGEKA